MAYFLEAAGYHDVWVLEKEDHVGGKCRTLRLDGRIYDMGAVEVTKNYTITNDLIARLGCTTEPVPDGCVVDYTNGWTRSALTLWDDSSKLEVIKQFAVFFIKQLELQPYLDKPGLKDIPPSLRGVSFAEWLRRIGAPLVGRFFWTVLTGYGYGELEKIPAVYALKFVTVMQFHVHALRLGLTDLVPSHMHLLDPFVQRITEGFQTLMERLAATLKHEPVLRAKIDEVVRGPQGVAVRYFVGDDPKPREENFDKIVIAIPQTLDNLSFLHCTPTEERLFREVFVNRYYTSLTKPETFDYKIYFELLNDRTKQVGPPPLPHVLMFARIWPQVPGSIFYTYSNPDDPRPLKGGATSIEGLVNGTITDLGQRPGGDVQSIAWDYFPQVSQTALDAGFYDDLEGIQGQNNTYYTGGLMSFELIEKTLEYSKALVGRFFP
jgi:hypothetical protein